MSAVEHRGARARRRPGQKKWRAEAEKARREGRRRRTRATACRRCRSSPSSSTASTGSSANRRSSSRSREMAAQIGISADEIERAASTSSSARTARRCKTIGATCWSGSSWSTWPARSSASAASGRARSSCSLQGRDQQDPLFLQVKEATASVLEDHLPKSRYRQPGERVVQGQRMMQAASDIFLGWTKGVDDNRYLYWRQLRDMKRSVDDRDDGARRRCSFYARICGRTLARAHARSGDPVAIAAYLGKQDRFDQSITDFSERYADQNERDYDAFIDGDPVRPVGGARRRLIDVPGFVREETRDVVGARVRDAEIAPEARAAPPLRMPGVRPHQELGRVCIPTVDLELHADDGAAPPGADRATRLPRRSIETERRERGRGSVPRARGASRRPRDRRPCAGGADRDRRARAPRRRAAG